MELSGRWSAAPADEDLRRTYPRPDFDDSTWTTLSVPGHWQRSDAFADHDGPVLYRHRFTCPEPAEGRRSWLVFDGVFYESDVWLDGSYVGDTEGYFHPHEFEVTDLLRGGTEHVVAAEVSCSPPRDLTAKRALTGVFQHWDCRDPDDNPGGIWRPVWLTETGPIRIHRLRVLCSEATAERALLDIRVLLDAKEAGRVELRTTVGDAVEHVQEATVAAGENRIEWTVAVEDPELWWPRSLGEQPLYEVNVSASVEGTVSDERALRTGLRQVAIDGWIATINGERLHLKGANQGPLLPWLADVSDERTEKVIELAQDAGLDFLRVHGHVAHPSLYDLADEAGLLLWQDMPLQWGYARGVRAQAARQAREAVDLLGHHPSVFLWCGHNEPMALDLEPGKPVDVVRTGLKALAMQQLPTWNKSIVDRRIRRALAKADPTRPVVAHSGVWPGLVAGGTDSHLYFGWYWGDLHDVRPFAAAWPRQVRFVSEFGAQAVPDSDAFMEPERWPDLDWQRLQRHHVLQRQFMAAHDLDPDQYETFDDWRAVTQHHQAELLRVHVETLRTLKYRPNGGFAMFSFADAHPAVSWSVLDHELAPKAGYHALAAACAPVIVVASPVDPVYEPGEHLEVDVHVVSDRRDAVEDCLTNLTLTLPDGSEQRWSWAGDLAADSCTFVGRARAVVGTEQGPLVLRLSVDGPDDAEPLASAEYRSTVFPL